MIQRLKYPIGIQSFPKIREGSQVYVDKTAEIYNLVTTPKWLSTKSKKRNIL